MFVIKKLFLSILWSFDRGIVIFQLILMKLFLIRSKVGFFYEKNACYIALKC